MALSTIPLVHTDTITITTSQTSTAYDLQGFTLVGIRTTTGQRGTSITFNVAPTSTGPWLALYNINGSAVTLNGVSTSAAYQYALSPLDMSGVQHVQIVSASTESSQSYTLVMRPV